MFSALPQGVCIYKGTPNPAALAADVIFWGNNAGIASDEIASFW